MFDVRIEAGVVGTLLVNPRFYYHFEALKDTHFYEETNRIIYRVVKEILEDNSEDVSDFTVYYRIIGNKAYEREFTKSEIDIQDYLDKLKLISAKDGDEYISRCKKVIDYAFRRDSIDKLKDITKYIETKDGTANELNMYIHDNIGRFSEQYIVGAKVQPFGEIVDDLWEEVLERQNPESGISGIPSKIAAINKYFTYEKGELILIAARPKAGKSFLALNEAIHKLKKQTHCTTM